MGGAQLVFDGDSLTVGDSYPDSYPYRTQELLSLCLGRLRNLAVGGQTIVQMELDAAAQVDALYDADYSHNILIAWGGTNDNAAGADATTIYLNIVTYCQRRQAAGWKVVVLTMLPRGADANFETRRQMINTNIRNHWATFADALADVGSDSAIGVEGDQNNADYYKTDAVHLNRNGREVVARLVKTAVESLL